ncbi:AraC family transcriptional regulator [Saccharicrinis fermentans]|uniref:Bacillibactin transport regulator n=1 Tax=Saccharicrinis fermentans DSM 9555 = JCM 21142 TaxID=869213 RepID=W7Y1S3_9BACT|nr:AraC family transcriptional regulator [Saccharicrinis fermentans]GAF01468.1 bacillibactin transport regulator [Saccharicrinis fermentans DSM 9555 = JCM 21142]
MNGRIIREIAPLSEDDFFVIMNHQNAKFDFPVHFHPEYEINLVLNAKGKRIIGDSIMEFSSPDLVMIGPNTPHAWTGNSPNAQVITLQFHSNFPSDNFLTKKLSLPIKDLLEQSKMGILFGQQITEEMIGRITKLSNQHGFDSVLDMLSLLYDLATSRNKTNLSSSAYVKKFDTTKSRRINMVNNYLTKNIHNTIKINEVAELVNMSPSAFSHFFKKRTQRSFTEYLTEMRIGIAARMLIDSDRNISEICYECGFSNISNFNRSFKSQKGCTPSEFRSQQKLVTIH